MIRNLGMRLRAAVEHPWAKAFIGVVFLACGMDDLLDSLKEGANLLEPGVHHGAIVFGGAQLLSALGGICEGLVELRDAKSE